MVGELDPIQNRASEAPEDQDIGVVSKVSDRTIKRFHEIMGLMGRHGLSRNQAEALLDQRTEQQADAEQL